MSTPPAGPGPSRSTWHIELRKILESYFDETELETLCFDLRVDYESLAGDSKTHKVVDLVRTFARTGRVDELIDYCSRMRPNVPWGQLRQAAATNPLVVDAHPDQPYVPPPRTPAPPASAPSGPTPSAPTPTPASPAPRRGWVYGLIAVLVVALGIAVWRIFCPPGPVPPPVATTTSTTMTFAPRTDLQTRTLATPAGFRVVEVLLRADPAEYVGPCPVRITFSGRVSVAGGSGTVAYKFLRSDGASGQVKTLTFDGPGTQAIEETWTLGAAGRTYSNWEAVQILDPDEVTSDKATFRITCTG